MASWRKEHLTRQVILGYASLLILSVVAVWYIFNLVGKIAEEKHESPAMEKVYLITDVLSLLYEGETYTLFSTNIDNEFSQFNRIMDQVDSQLDSLQVLTDSTSWGKLDTIHFLLKEKRDNIALILTTLKEVDSVYERSLAKEMSVMREIRRELEIRKEEESSKDTVIVQREQKGFFRRLAEAFVPVKVDTAIHITASKHIKIDSLVTSYDPSEDISVILMRVQQEITEERNLLTQELTVQITKLRQSSNRIAKEINRILAGIEAEEVSQQAESELTKQEMIQSATRHLAVIAVIAIVVVLIFFYLTMRDIWRSRYYRKQLEEANRYAEELLQSREKLMLTISHDIRAPLSSILGYTELLKKNENNVETREYIDNMHVSAEHILSLVNDLLDFHRLESGRMKIHPSPFRVPALFKEIYTGFKPLADAKGLQFILESEKDDTQTYMGDTVRIRQVVGNLLSNAIKFTSQGEISMHVAVADVGEDEKTRMLTVAVKDEGPGMTEEEQQRIFGEFTRLAGAEKTEGFGLGLSITGKLVALMDGQLSLQSTPGEGSEFTVTLPLPLSDVEIATEAIEEATKETTVSKTAKRRINCLVIDDDKAQIRLTEELLKRSKVNAIALMNPHDATDLLGRASFDIVLTDIQMPGMDGYELLKQIRASGIAGADTIPVVALSASAEEDPEHYREAGFAGFLSKPFTSEQLITLLNEILAAELSPVDVSSLTAFAGDDPEAQEAILRTFTEETTKNLALMREALANDDTEQIGRIAHKLVPLIKMLGQDSLADQLISLEKNELSGEALIDATEDVMRQVSDIIQQVLPNK